MSSKIDPSPEDILIDSVWKAPNIIYFPTKKKIKGEVLWHLSTIFYHWIGYFNPPDNIDFLLISRRIALDFRSHDVKIFYSFLMTLPFLLRKPPKIEAFN